jgi:hypothetical protein
MFVLFVGALGGFFRGMSVCEELGREMIGRMVFAI